MDPQIIDLRSLTLAGFSFFGDPFDTSNVWQSENQIGRLWSRLMDYLQGGKDAVLGMIDPGVAYEVHIHNLKTPETGHFEVFVGVEVEDIQALPVDLLVKVLPSSSYAVFQMKGAQILGDWELDIQHWLEQSRYREAHTYNFQYYDQRFLGLDRIDDSEIDVYIPIVEQE
jgi:predicted transcriptional regulator YdeE